jgi:hypothetical protein
LTAKEKLKGYEVVEDKEGNQKIFAKLDKSDKRYIKGVKERIEITKR